MNRICPTAFCLHCAYPHQLHCRMEARKSIERNHVSCRGESGMTYLWLWAGGVLSESTLEVLCWIGIRRAGSQNPLKSLKFFSSLDP